MGFIKFVLSPVSEEIILRGFIYGYLRTRTRRSIAIILQSFLSSIFHIYYILTAIRSNELLIVLSYLIFVNIVFGLLYEKTKSLYPPIICHGLYNYLVYIFPLL
jgi:uncharacterized protein